MVPTYAWNLLWHPDGRSVYAMLCDPEGYDPNGELSHTRRKNHPRIRRRDLIQKKRARIGQNTKPIIGYDSRLCMFSHYQMDRANINKCEHGGSTADENTSREAYKQTMAITHNYASTFFAAIKIIEIKRPKKPPDGYLAAALVLLMTMSIFSSLTAIAAIRLAFLPKPKSKKRKRRIRK